MRVRLLSPMFLPPDMVVIEPIGKTVEVSDEMAKDWIARGLAVDGTPIPYKPPPPEEPPKKGRR